jgi:hypothetical protein
MAARITPRGARRTRLIALGAMAERAGRALRGWARVPILPYATLWEASMVATLLATGELFEPDRYAAQAPFLMDTWPHG